MMDFHFKLGNNSSFYLNDILCGTRIFSNDFYILYLNESIFNINAKKTKMYKPNNLTYDIVDLIILMKQESQSYLNKDTLIILIMNLMKLVNHVCLKR